MRTFIKSILFLGIVAFIFTSCEEDEFTEKDAMDQLQNIDVALNVTDGSSYSDVVDGATVQLVGDSTINSKTTDNAGNVTFRDVPVGTNLSVYVHKENFTKAVYNISTLTDSYRENMITENLKIYSLSGDNMATVKGKLEIETDLTNREREVLAGEEVRVINNSLEGNNSRSFVGTTDEEGYYSIQVPVTPRGDDDLQVKYPSLVEKDQALAVETEDGTYKVDTVPAEFYFSSYDYSVINDNISSAIPEVEAPIGAGSGFALGVEANPTLFSDYSNIEIVKGGSGYSSDTLSLSEGVNGLSAKVIIDVDANGAINDIFYNGTYYDQETGTYMSYANGALYTSEPTLDISSLGGSGAELDIQFEGEYKVFVDNYGDDYVDIPTVSADYKAYEGGVIAKRFDQAINRNYSNDLKGGYYGLDAYLQIHNGSIYPDNSMAYDGDTLFVTDGLVDITELGVSETTSEQAEISLGINSEGEIVNYSLNQSSGYDPENPPEITVTSLAGYGAGAELKTEVNTSGSVYSVSIVSSGEGYVLNVNDYDGDGFNTNNRGENSSISSGYIYSSSSSSAINDVGAGDVETRNVYYGTGIRKE